MVGELERVAVRTLEHAMAEEFIGSRQIRQGIHYSGRQQQDTAGRLVQLRRAFGRS